MASDVAPASLPPAWRVAAVAAERTRDLRARVLRPGRPLERSRYREDPQPEGRHFGALAANGALVGCGSIHPQAHPDGRDGGGSFGAWRVRGMAVEPGWRRRGVGRALLAACIAHAAAQGGRLVWMRARTTASAFYRAQGFSAAGHAFEVPQQGPHVLMELSLAAPDGSPRLRAHARARA